MIIAANFPLSIGERRVTEVDGEDRPFIVLREATEKEFLDDLRNPDQFRPEAANPTLAQLAEIVNNPAYKFYKIAVD